MPNLKSSIKSEKVSKKKGDTNTVYTSRIKNSIKKLDKAVSNKDEAQSRELLKETTVNIDKAYQKGLIKNNARNRQKSRLNKKVKGMNK